MHTNLSLLGNSTMYYQASVHTHEGYGIVVQCVSVSVCLLPSYVAITYLVYMATIASRFLAACRLLQKILLVLCRIC